MLDQFHRSINYLRISVTDRCNFRCSYCMPQQGVVKKEHRDILSLEEIAEIADAALSMGVEKIRLTGGEPLVRKGIEELCAKLKENENLKELALTTNACLLPEKAEILKKSGVDRLNISLDTLREDRFRMITRGGELGNTLRGIDAAEEAGFQNTKINTVLIGGFNDDEITGLTALTRQRDLTVRFIELMPIGEASVWPASAFVSADEVLRQLPELEPAGTDGVAEMYCFPGAPGKVGLIRPLSRCFCGSCSRIRLTADGMLKPCLHSDLEIPLRGLHGRELRDRIREAVFFKPEKHFLDRDGISGTASRRMNEIGG
ncbi:MAG: GTP 3',8-cyclase MoaA [Anaerolineaceae bacterium]|nr:GTP 3',8-cyclase MoaA [Anaerolineaceae bacterium]